MQPQQLKDFFAEIGITETQSGTCSGTVWGETTSAASTTIESTSPSDGQLIGKVVSCSSEGYGQLMGQAQKAFEQWRTVPAPKRGDVVREIGQALRRYKEPLGMLVAYEMGKIYQEGLGEVQEMIDICDFATGLSRQLYGLTMHSERPEHRMYEQYHPLGVVGIISAFNFPVAVWSWNAMVAAVCGNTMIWKPSEKTPFCAIACHKIISQVLKDQDVPEGVFNLAIGDAELGKNMANDPNIALLSATGSTRMGRSVGQAVAARMGKSLLELGGNNAIIITENANMEMAIRAAVFGAVGTAGQRCTSTRRLIIHENVYDEVKERLLKVYPTLSIGSPLEPTTLVGPLIDGLAVQNFKNALIAAEKEGGTLLTGGEVLTEGEHAKGFYVQPALVEAENHYKIVQEETFAPILYLIKYTEGIEEAVKIHNDVKQGLSSAIFSENILETEYFLSHRGSDCGIANVNIGTSGAEIGGAFGGEKETGGGRESGSDAWKAYMRRQTNTINYGSSLPLAQGIKFEI